MFEFLHSKILKIHNPLNNLPDTPDIYDEPDISYISDINSIIDFKSKIFYIIAFWEKTGIINNVDKFNPNVRWASGTLGSGKTFTQTNFPMKRKTPPVMA